MITNARVTDYGFEDTPLKKLDFIVPVHSWLCSHYSQLRSNLFVHHNYTNISHVIHLSRNIVGLCTGLTLICIEALQNHWCFRGIFLFCHHLHLEPRVMQCQLPVTLDFSLWPLLVPIINRGYLFGLSTSSTTLFC